MTTKAEAVAAYQAAGAEYRKAERILLAAEARLDAACSARDLAAAVFKTVCDGRYRVAKQLLAAVHGPGWVGATIEEAERVLRVEAGEEAAVVELYTRRAVRRSNRNG